MKIGVIDYPFIVIYNASLFIPVSNYSQGFIVNRLYTYKQMSTR